MFIELASDLSAFYAVKLKAIPRSRDAMLESLTSLLEALEEAARINYDIEEVRNPLFNDSPDLGFESLHIHLNDAMGLLAKFIAALF